MVKKIKDEGNTNSMEEILQMMVSQQKEFADRLTEMEDQNKNKTSANEALLRMVNLTYDTDDQHLPELTRIPIQAARPHALGMMLESLFDEDVQDGSVPLSRKLRNSYFRLMRSVGGVHLGRGVRLAEEQASAEQEKAEEFDLGGE
jgi:hypothetical protein